MNQCNQFNIKWFAVTVRLDNVFRNRFWSYGIDSKGVTRMISFYRDGQPFAVVQRAGDALRSVAEQTAKDLGGTVEVIEACYSLNDADIPQDPLSDWCDL